jgi:hypothetical protein
MGSVGDCYSNSMIESFWSRMQVELLDRKKWQTSVELTNATFDYLKLWHNKRRRHGQLTPIEFERVNAITVACEIHESRLRGTCDRPRARSATDWRGSAKSASSQDSLILGSSAVTRSA